MSGPTYSPDYESEKQDDIIPVSRIGVKFEEIQRVKDLRARIAALTAQQGEGG